MEQTSLPVAVIGAGPVGLAAASHLVQRGMQPLVFEQGNSVASTILDWSHVRLFSPWRYNVDPAAKTLLDRAGWKEPDLDVLPTGKELIEQYLGPLANTPDLIGKIHYESRVVAVGRRDHDKVKTDGREDAPFQLTVEHPGGSASCHEAAAVIDASGTWLRPNPMASGGIPAPGEIENGHRIHYGIPDVLGARRAHYANKRVLVVGSGHSAINALLDLIQLQETAKSTDVLWALRKETIQSAFGGRDDDALPGRGALGTRAQAAVEAGKVEVVRPFRTRRVDARADSLLVSGLLGREMMSFEVDRVIVATGARPDLEMLREVRVNLDSWLECPVLLAPLIDPNEHSCGAVRAHGAKELAHPEKDFYIAGAKSYGRAPTFLLATGYEQVRSIVAALAGDPEAAARVELDLPQTGVCNSSPQGGVAGSSCCGPRKPAQAQSSCCG